MSKLKIALERAKKIRESKIMHGDEISSHGEQGKIEPLQKRDGKRSAAKKLDIAYVHTKVQKVDPEILRKNKIYALFKDNDTNDQIEMLRTQILHKLKDMNGNTILVTSANPGEGKTFVSINLGVSIAQQLDKTALIVDTDIRKPWKHHMNFSDDFWGIKTDKGLSDYFLGNADIEEIMINPGIDKLTIIPGGKSLPNSAGFLASSKMEELVVQLKQRYSERIIIFDSASMLKYSDSLVFSHLIDGVLLVIEAEKTTPDEVKKTISLLKDQNILGCVYNKNRATGDS